MARKTTKKEAKNIEWLGYSPKEVERVIIKLIKAEMGGGTVKKHLGGLPQGYNARLDESLGARNRARGNLAARRAESEGMERALGRRPYAAVGTMAKKGGSVRRKKGSTVSRKRGSKVMKGYKAGGKV